MVEDQDFTKKIKDYNHKLINNKDQILISILQDIQNQK
jgi:hypothetical protein